MVQTHLDSTQIDWEYPQNSSEAKIYVQLLEALRHGLDDSSRQKNKPPGSYELTVAVPCGKDYEKLDVRGMDQWVSFWNLMVSLQSCVVVRHLL